MVDHDRLYRIFDDLTPLRGRDCGILCGKRCCAGDGRTGMLLFPGEETTLPVVEKDGRRFAVCSGRCDRSIRPLSCRIFPLFPRIEGNGACKARLDVRGNSVCPLVRAGHRVAFDPAFVFAVEVAGRALAADEGCRAFLDEINAEIDDAVRLAALLGR